jgi:hypothetical protein
VALACRLPAVRNRVYTLQPYGQRSGQTVSPLPCEQEVLRLQQVILAVVGQIAEAEAVRLSL